MDEAPPNGTLFTQSGRLEGPIDGFALSKKLGDDLARPIMATEDPVFADAQTPKARELARQGDQVSLPSSAYIIERAANVPPYARMEALESGDDLIRKFQAGMLLAS